MSIPVGQSSSGTTTSQDRPAGAEELAMDIQIEGGDGGGKSSDGNDAAEASSSSTCPLFMSGLPSDFASNSSLAAIASLLGDEEYDSDVDVRKVRKGLKPVGTDNKTACGDAGDKTEAAAAAKPRVGGGKVGGAGAARRNNKSGSRKKSGAHHQPYPTTSAKKKGEGKQKASVGEAQLFLNMWKI